MASRSKAAAAKPSRKASGERRRLRPEIRRLEIVAAAARVMRKAGAAASVEDVVREAGAARGTFYLYFPTWELLVQELRRLVFAEFARQSAALADAPSAGDWPAQVSRFAQAFVDFTVALGGLHEALFRGPGATLPVGADPHSAVRPVATMLRGGTAAGGLAVADPDATARLLYVAMLETADAIRRGEGRERALMALIDLTQRAVAPERIRTPA